MLKEAFPPEKRESMEACLTSRDDPWMNPESQKYEPFHESLRIEIQDNPLQSDFDRDSEDEAAFGKMTKRCHQLTTRAETLETRTLLIRRVLEAPPVWNLTRMKC